MEEKQARLAYLLDVYSAKKATSEELEELFTLIETDGSNALKVHLRFLLQSYDKTKTDLPAVNWDGLYREIMLKKDPQASQMFLQQPEQPLERDTEATPDKSSEVPRVALRRSLLRWSAVAAVLLFIGTGAFYFFGKNAHPGTDTTKTALSVDGAAPESMHATLTLSDGRRIQVGSAAGGLLATEGAVQIDKASEGGLVYSGGNSDTQRFNTLSNPSGSKVLQLTLEDGTKVWLNAASSLTFPASFSKQKRAVTLNGEGYFEVAHNSSRPFFVQKGNVSVQVLGTHFNVAAYSDEKAIKVTLVEGLVNVKSGSVNQIIRPGQQAVIDSLPGSAISLKKDINMDEVMAWYNGKFTFKDQDIHTIMRQVSRWYNVDIAYQGTVDEHFYADVSRNTNVGTLLKMLEATGAVHFKLENKKITVMTPIH